MTKEIVKSIGRDQREEIASLIKRRRLQLLVHSAIYYHFNESIISDNQWGIWAKELVCLQNKYPEISNQVVYSDAFKSFNVSTGYDLPFTDPPIYWTAMWILKLHKERMKIQ